MPHVSRLDLAFGNVNHLPPMSEIPDRFTRSNDPYVKFIFEWFFSGRNPEDMARLTEKPGVDRYMAICAIRAALASFKPRHGHKVAGCAFLLSEWFVLDEPHEERAT